MSSRVIRRAWVVTVFVAGVAVLWFTRRILLLLFASLLVGLILCSLINLLRRVVPLGQKSGLAVVLLLGAGLCWLFAWLAAPSIADQFSELAQQLPKRMAEVRELIQNSTVFQKANDALPALEDMIPSGGAGRVASFFSSTMEAVSGLGFILFAALFLAANPDSYRGMVVKLFSPRLRGQAEETIGRVVCTLKYWMGGQLVSMVVVGIGTGVALKFAGVPFALSLGIIAGLLEFIPVVGPIIAAVPALLLASIDGGQKLLIVTGIFVVIQFLEGNVLQPIVQRTAVDLPPIVLLVALLALGGSFGLLGLFVAAPLAAVVLVLIEDLYLKRYLGTDDKIMR